MKLATEADNTAANAAVTFSKISLTTKKLRLDWELSTESLEDNIEGADLEDHIARLMATQAGNDIEDVVLNGNTSLSSDALYKAFDGVVKLSKANGRVVDGGGNTVSREIFNKALKAMPRKYKQRRNDLRFLAGSNLIQDFLYKNSITAGIANPEDIASSVIRGQQVALGGPAGFVANATGGTFALIYPGFISGFIFLLARSGDGFEYIATLVVLVGCNDTFAYLTGILIGKHPLAPQVSPKKSWEGVIGGLVFAAIGTALAFHYLLEYSPALGALAAIGGVLAATIGDLVESAIKRDLALKDMGKLLPGHGGMLDRLDSVLFVAPILWCFVEILKRVG